MQIKNPSVPKVAITSTGSGLLLMALFTTIWALIAWGNMAGLGRWPELIIFVGLGITFIMYAIYFFTIAKYFTDTMTDAQKAEGKKLSKWYGIIFGAEGISIPIVVNVLIYFKLGNYIIPAIAMIVGLHFYPMAKIFKRTIDYYLATWTCIVALTAIIMIKNNSMPLTAIVAFVGIGVACATGSYGLYMIKRGFGMVKKASQAL